MESATALAVLALALPNVAAAIPPLYFRAERQLSVAAPTATSPHDDVSAAIGAMQRAVLGEFRSDPADEELHASSAFVTLFLVSGKEGMEECARVWVEIARRNPPDQRATVGSGSVFASIFARRETVDPIEVPVALEGGLVAEPGEQIAVTVAVENDCADLRGPALLYDALGMASAVRFSDEPVATLPPPTTTSTSTTTPRPAPETTTTTLPWPAGCLERPLVGYDAVFCRLDTLGEVLAEEDPADVGGQAVYARLQRRLQRTHALVAVAQTRTRSRRRLRRAQQTLGAFARVVRRQGRHGRADPDLSEELTGLAAAASAEIGSLR